MGKLEARLSRFEVGWSNVSQEVYVGVSGKMFRHHRTEEQHINMVFNIQQAVKEQ